MFHHLLDRKSNGLRVLDLFCGAGGISMGWYAAGFDVVGVDINPQPHYPFEFHQSDALEFPLDGFDMIVASPSCQRYSKATKWRGKAENHPDLIPPTRRRLEASGLPYVMENVPGAPLRPDLILCGSHFGLPVRRHRLFETNWGGRTTLKCDHSTAILPFEHRSERAFANAMGCTWMTAHEGRQAVPPAYAHHIAGLYLEVVAT